MSVNNMEFPCLQRINERVYNHVIENKQGNETFTQTLERLLFHVRVNPVFDELEMRYRSVEQENERLKENKLHILEINRLMRKRLEEIE